MSRSHLFIAFAAFTAGFGIWAQNADPTKVQLRGNRFPPLKWETMTPEQQAMTRSVLSGTRTSLNGPFNVLLRSPEMGDYAQKFGESMRFRSTIPKHLNEMAIIMVARFWTSQYEWRQHRIAAQEAKLPEATIKAIAEGRRPQGMDAETEAVYNFCSEMLNKRDVSDATFNAVKAKFGERGIVDLIGVMGWYHTVSMALNADHYPLPDGAQPELKPLP